MFLWINDICVFTLLQAFVHFMHWWLLRRFVEEFLKNSASIKSCKVYVHQVLEEVPSGYSEVCCYWVVQIKNNFSLTAI